MSIAKQLGIFKSYGSYGDIPPAKKAWITIKAKQAGLNPNMVHAGIKAAYKKKANKAAKADAKPVTVRKDPKTCDSDCANCRGPL
jgi:hypothetical protein